MAQSVPTHRGFFLVCHCVKGHLCSCPHQSAVWGRIRPALGPLSICRNGKETRSVPSPGLCGNDGAPGHQRSWSLECPLTPLLSLFPNLRAGHPECLMALLKGRGILSLMHITSACHLQRVQHDVVESLGEEGRRNVHIRLAGDAPHFTMVLKEWLGA